MKKNTDGKTENRFNLVDEPWIPIPEIGLVSLRRLFQDTSLRALGGNPVQKIAVMKLLLAICQAACTPEGDTEWAKLGPKGLAKKVLTYLEDHRDCFWLYGEKPFLQIPAIAQAEKQPFGAVMPDIATGNTTILTHSQIQRQLSDPDKALLVVQLISMAQGGKKTDNKIVLTLGYRGKYNEKGRAATGKPGTGLGFLGYLHNVLTGSNLLETLWLNLLTEKNIKDLGIFPKGVGPIPWETPPKGESDTIAEKLKKSLMGRLVPFSRFLLLAEDGVHYSEGIAYPNHLEGVTDPSVALDKSGKKPQVLWTDPSKRPWRSLPALLEFLKGETAAFNCPYISFGIYRGRKKLSHIGLWSGGLRVSSNAGEQYVSGTDDYVESELFFESKWFDEYFYINLKKETAVLDDISRILYGCIMGYYKSLKTDGKVYAEKACELFWQLCERKAQNLLDACGDEDGKEAETLRSYFLGRVRYVYENYCPRDTARQLQAWAEHYPNLIRFSKPKEPTKVQADS
jgi:CRISPR system Cascade subunit CasA